MNKYNNMKISITSKKKIQNPTINENNNYSFEGEFNDNMFNEESEQFTYLKHQRKTFETLKIYFEKMDLRFEHIWLGNFLNTSGHNSINFVIKTNINNNNEQIFWQKYCSITPGSGHNNLHFIKDDVVINKISVIKWIENNEKQIN